MMVIAVTCLVH